MSDSEQLPVPAAHDLQAALHGARLARREAELAGCEMEDLAAVLHRKPPVGRCPQPTRASSGPTVAVLSG